MTAALQFQNSPQWITGAVGGSRTAWLAESLFEKLRLAASKRSLREIKKYTPWMCFHEETERFSPFFESDNLLVTDANLLRALRSVFWTEPRRPLHRAKVTFPWVTVDIKAGQRNLDLFLRAIELVNSASPTWALRRQTLARSVVPLKALSPRARAGGVGFSAQVLKGAVFLSRPKLGDLSAIELAINLSHEIGHQSLYIYQSSDRIIAGDLEQPVFSAIRKTERPAILAFHALAALAAMIDFANNRLKNSSILSAVEIDYLDVQLRVFQAALAQGLSAFEHIPLTELGNEMRLEFQNLIDRKNL